MSRSPTKNVSIYTDGACRGNPGPGGYGAVLVYKNTRKEISGGYRWTTNNRMELMALVRALSFLKEPCKLDITSDSKYLLGGFNEGWIKNWKQKGWKTSTGRKVQNQDLWEQLDELLSPHIVKFIWVKGHAEHEENNRCDKMAVIESNNPSAGVDAEYERSKPYKERPNKAMQPTPMLVTDRAYARSAPSTGAADL